MMADGNPGTEVADMIDALEAKLSTDFPDDDGIAMYVCMTREVESNQSITD